ncbi:MAG: cytochrome c oxidase subunit II [Arcobacter sp.]|nr:cytochrome c oxidase subunit II [Arcobacter sp.]
MLEGIEGVSSFAENIDYTFWMVNLICLFLFIITIGAMFIFIYKYSEKRSKLKDTENIKHNLSLEIAWTVIPTILLMYVFYIGLDALKVQRTMPEDNKAIVVKVTGMKWSWSFEYENGKKSSELTVPVNKDIKLIMTAPINDILHAFFVPSFRIKEDVIPGQITKLWFNSEKKGKFDILCAEYCGTRHAYMRSYVNVVSQENFEEFLNPKVVVKKTADEILNQLGCIGCHTTDGTPSVGPSFKDLYNTEVKVTVNGETKTVKRDEAYLKRAIEDPNYEVPEGYTANVMPGFKGALTDEEMQTVINYFKGIEEDTTPKLNGEDISSVNGCIGCHTTDGTPSAGPTFKGIMGRKTEIIRDGKTMEITIDEEYLRKAIVDPSYELVKDYANIMPPFKDVLNKDEVDAIIEYLKK